MPVIMDNLTERLQAHLGLQQAQTIQADDMCADAIARLMECRGDASSLLELWSPANWRGAVADYRPEIHDDVLRELLRVLDATMVVQRQKNTGRPKTFLPVFPELISAQQASTLYRELGRTVMDGLWRSTEQGTPGFLDSLKALIKDWPNQHPLAQLLRPFCVRKDSPNPPGGGNFEAALVKDELLANWVRTTAAQDWQAYLLAATRLSSDEQLEMMNALIGLHLHVALLYRLRGREAEKVRPVYFVAASRAPDDERSCDRSAYNCFCFWRDRAADSMQVVAEDIIEQTAHANADLSSAMSSGSWNMLSSWTAAEIKKDGKRKRATQEFRDRLLAQINEAESKKWEPTKEIAFRLLVDALFSAFDRPSGPAVKAKDFLRNTGRAAGIVGPEGSYRRKRYQLEDRAIEMLIRLHADRQPGTIHTDEDERQSIGAWLDDISERYGMIVTLERERARKMFEHATESTSVLRALRSHFPGERAMAANREHLDARLDMLRCVRRYSDASSVIYVS